MGGKMKRFHVCCLWLIVLFSLAGCAGPRSYSSQSDFPTTWKQAKKVGVIVPVVDVFEIAVGGQLTLDKEQSSAALKSMEAGTVKAFTEKQLEAKIMAFDPALEIALKSWIPIYPNIRQQFPDSKTPTSTPIIMSNAQELCKQHAVDMIAVIRGKDHVQSAGRKAANVALTVAFAVLGGVHSSRGIAYADLALIDASGRTIFYDQNSGTNFTLTSSGDAVSIVSQMLDNAQKVTTTN